MESVFQIRVYFIGRVQGVGFRYSASRMARGYELTGFVRNLIDGRVELIAQGEQKECRAFVKALADEMEGFIREKHATESTAEPCYKEFSIR